MKRYLILLLPGVLFPYVFLFFLFGFFRGFLLDWIGENPLLLFLWLGIWFFVSLLANLAFFLLALGKQWAGKSLALISMVLKLIQIPAYVTVFLLSCIFAITIWLFAFVIVLFFFDCLTILLTGFMGLAASIRCAGEKRVSKGLCIANGILSFVFCADVVLAIIFSIKSRRPVSQQPLYSKEDGFTVSLAGNTPSNKNSKLRKGE